MTTSNGRANHGTHRTGDGRRARDRWQKPVGRSPATACGSRSRTSITRARQDVAGALAGPGHAAFAVDVAQGAAVQQLFDAVEAALGPIGVLVTAAGGPFVRQGEQLRLIDTSLDNWIRTEALNGRGTFLCVRTRIPAPARAQSGCGPERIVTIASLAALARQSVDRRRLWGGQVRRHQRHPPCRDGRCAARHHRQCDRARPDRHAGGAREFHHSADRGCEGDDPVGDIGQPADIAEMIAYLASPKARFITGATIDVNGGVRMA